MPTQLKLPFMAAKTNADAKTLKAKIEAARKSNASIQVNMKRVRLLSTHDKFKEGGEAVVYWMSRDQRVQDNWALLFAQQLAKENDVPLYVCFCMVSKFLDATIRHFDFMLKGLQEVEAELIKLHIPFHLLLGSADTVLPEFVKANDVGAVVTDFAALRVPLSWVDKVKKKLSVAFFQVDAHNVVPVWEASNKQEVGARTIRSKIQSKLGTFLTEFPPVTSQSASLPDPVDWDEAYENLQVDETVKPITWATPGYTGGIQVLSGFLESRLKGFDARRNDPNQDNQSNMSAYYHFGQVSVQRALLCVKSKKDRHPMDVAAYIEEACVRRELSDNFCFYNPDYDKITGGPKWGQETLDDHRKDKREHLYSLKELDRGETYDELWNASQMQLVHHGKMHGFMRMYWAKKILEWSKTPEEAISHAIYLNDRYEIDGRDANGYVGIMWSMTGVHDHPWTERSPAFGKVRYMNYNGCKRKFDVQEYINRWTTPVGRNSRKRRSSD